jgi:D-alanyl-D-alanine dipeptidase
MKKLWLLLLISSAALANPLPAGFVFLKDIDPTIMQTLRYKTTHNFIGRPIVGYSEKTECVLTLPAAQALHQVQTALRAQHLSLQVYDCYRPQRAVNDFIAWSKLPKQEAMKAEFYPRVDKAKFFDLGYVVAKSGHTRGSTVDLSIVPIPYIHVQTYHLKQPLVACYAPFGQRFRDGSLDMGTGFDCMDNTAYIDNQTVSKHALKNRKFLQTLMMKYGFEPYFAEWWHFTLKNEPYPNTYFDFLANR